MTFTIKAAGELEIRLQREFLNMVEEDQENSTYWQMASDSLDYLNVSTIHGFCFKLIKGGYFENISPDQEILSDTEFNEIILQLLNNWLSDEKNKSSEIYDIILKEKNNVFQSMLSIFSDASLRDYWVSIKDINDIEIGIESILKELFQAKGLVEIFDEDIDLDPEFSKKAWYPFVDKFIDFKRNVEFNLDGVAKMYLFFEKEQFKIPRKPTGKAIPPEIVNYYELIKSLKDYLKKNGEHFFKFKQYQNTRVSDWFYMTKSLVDYIESEYAKKKGITFADLEYIVYQGVKSDEAVKLISEEFQYFIIDEFQDTSYIQFSIVERIIQKDFSKLFCVGDLKQAIYGFRGGELKVFQDCKNKIPQYLELSNNYRSLENVIHFNNKIFESIFAKGVGFNGIDPHGINVTPQLSPIEQENKGNVLLLETNLSFLEEYKLKNSDVDSIEMLVIYNQITDLISRRENIAILYKKLRPSLLLINKLIEENMSFTAQVKIPFLEDPIIGIFNLLLEYPQNISQKKSDFVFFMIDSYMSLMGTENKKSIDLGLFYQNIKNIGLYHAFCDLLDILGIKNSNYKNNLQQIKTIIKAANGELDEILLLLGRMSSSAYSLDFQYGETPQDIIIMTAHASKGLEFDHVFVGGLYTNENSPMMTSSIGKIPLSFKWTDSIHGKKRYKTPYLIWEEELLKQKEFSESKRLFYVANTRAKKSLNLTVLDFGATKRSKNQSSSWAAGISSWLDDNPVNLFEMKPINIQDQVDLANFENEVIQLPLFHIDNIGLLNINSDEKKVYIPELSVTRLATVVECPRKFYFQNILKISNEEIGLVDSRSDLELEDELSDTLTSHSFLASSAKRGTELHEQISKVIQENLWEVERNDNTISWVVEKLRKYLENFELISEYPIKFELFDYMLSGIPDLIIRPLTEVSTHEIWDFKTGALSEEKLIPYWFQLMCYAYAEFKFLNLAPDYKIKLVLCFIDEQKLVEKEVTIFDVEKNLSKALEKLVNFEEENLNACKYCSYKIICQK